MITLGKHGDLHSRRQAIAIIREKSVVHKVFDELAQRYQNRAGGYTRIVKVGFRRGDASPMCMLELITEGGEKGGRKVKKSRKKAEETPAKAESAASATG
jgi:large subunit ribosomal protein L17